MRIWIRSRPRIRIRQNRITKQDPDPTDITGYVFKSADEAEGRRVGGSAWGESDSICVFSGNSLLCALKPTALIKWKSRNITSPLCLPLFSLDFSLSFFTLSLALLTISTASTHTHIHTTGANSRVLWSPLHLL
jgi:hypothetical protein